MQNVRLLSAERKADSKMRYILETAASLKSPTHPRDKKGSGDVPRGE